MQDKNIAISELKKLIEKCKGKFVETQFDKPSVVRQPNAQRIPKPPVLGKPTPFSNSSEMRRMYRIATTITQTRTPQLPHASRNTNPHVSKSTGANHYTSVSRPQLKSYQVKDKVTTRKTLNVNVVCAECGKCVFNSNHDACVSRYLNDVNARTKKPKVVPISASKPKRKANKSVATPHKKTVASDTTIQKSKSYYKKLYENTNQEWKWWIAKRCPSVYTWTQKPLRTKKIWMPKIRKDDESTSISPTIDIVSRITNVLKISNSLGSNLSNVPSSSNSLADCTTHPIHWNVTIKRVYYVEGLNHNLFSVGQFCDADLEVAFRKSTCFVRDLQGNDLLTGSRGSDLYTISLQETTSSTPICFMAKASPTQAWLWHRRLSHLNFDYITLLSKKDVVTGLPKLTYVKDQLCSSCEMSKAKRSSFKSKVVPSSKGRLNLLHMDLCGPMRVASINGKKYILVIVDDYSRYTWTLFLRSKDETPEVLKDFLTMIQRNLQAQVITVRTDRGTEFLNKTLHAYFKEEGIEHQTSTPRTPEQNGVVERRNRTMLKLENVSSGLVPQGQKASDYDNSDPVPPRQNVVPIAEKTDSSQQGLEFLFSPLLEELLTIQQRCAEEKTTMIKHRMHRFTKMTFSILFVHEYKKLVSLSFKKLRSSIRTSSWKFQMQVQQDDSLPRSKMYADHAECLDTRKCTSGGIQLLGDKLFCWMSKNQELHCNVFQQSRVVRLGINPMIQPEPEDLPKDNPKLEIAVL
ncbi:retrovirus-related pol polyprotein from transposon TNT 1-94, partial [Tanacetum coccineum]